MASASAAGAGVACVGVAVAAGGAVIVAFAHHLACPPDSLSGHVKGLALGTVAMVLSNQHTNYLDMSDGHQHRRSLRDAVMQRG